MMNGANSAEAGGPAAAEFLPGVNARYFWPSTTT